MKFYEVRRQLQNRNRWVSDAFLQKKEDAEYYAKMKRKWFEEKYKNLLLEESEDNLEEHVTKRLADKASETLAASKDE